MKKEFIIDLKGKKYPTYAGVLDEAHEKGLDSIETKLIQIPSEENGNTAIIKAVVKSAGKTFEAYGDASPINTNKLIATALIRMAETRAKGRALRDSINCGDTLLEEIPEDEPAQSQSKPPFEQNPWKKAEGQKHKTYQCSDCNSEIHSNVYKFSTDVYGKAYCMKCQKKHTPSN